MIYAVDIEFLLDNKTVHVARYTVSGDTPCDAAEHAEHIAHAVCKITRDEVRVIKIGETVDKYAVVEHDGHTTRTYEYHQFQHARDLLSDISEEYKSDPVFKNHWAKMYAVTNPDIKKQLLYHFITGTSPTISLPSNVYIKDLQCQ